MQLGPITTTPAQDAGLLSTAVALGALFLFTRRSQGRSRVMLTYLTVIATACSVIYWVTALALQADHAANALKIVVALSASSCVLFESERARQRRPVAERWKRFVGVTLGVASITVYFNGFRIGYAKFWHRHDQYHYYLGAKYFPELGYDTLYRCTVVAQDEIGRVTETIDGRSVTIDLRAEVRAADKKIRNLGGDNLLMPASVALEHPEACKARFSAERWEQWKRDISFFRFTCSSDKEYWDKMQRDHGYNPPPVWTLAGHLVSNLHDASDGFMQLLGALDEVYLLAMFAGVFWAFGWRIFAVAAILWGCQGNAPNYWTMGALLRQDWLFWLVMAACFARKRYFKLAGASMVYAGLLRVFPGLAVLGWLVVAGAYLVKHRRMKPAHAQMLLGGSLAAAVLVGASLVVVGRDSYQQFYKHTIEVHDQTPLTNHMGLRVLVSHRMECIIPGFPGCDGKASGRMKYVEDASLFDPFDKWRQMRLERYAKYKPVAYGIIALSAALFVLVVRRIKSMWLALALAQIWIVLLSQLTSYYYAFIIITAPITRVRRDLEAWIFGFAALTQFIWLSFRFIDDRYTALTLVTLIFCYALLLSLAPARWFRRRAAPESVRPD
jgi:hypothetical protein